MARRSAAAAGELTGRATEDFAQRADRILDAAAALLVRWGYRKTTIDDVARAAGVGKGTIYLHWTDKNELFRAALWRAHRQANDAIQQRVAADPDGGLPHRLWTHGLLVALDNPLLAAMMKDQPDILHGLIGALDRQELSALMGTADTYIGHLRQAGLVRPDLPIPMMTYLMTALKVGIINTPDLLGQEYVPPLADLAEALSDLIRRWLEPMHLPVDSTAGKRALTEMLDRVSDIETASGEGGQSHHGRDD